MATLNHHHQPRLRWAACTTTGHRVAAVASTLDVGPEIQSFAGGRAVAQHLSALDLAAVVEVVGSLG